MATYYTGADGSKQVRNYLLPNGIYYSGSVADIPKTPQSISAPAPTIPSTSAPAPSVAEPTGTFYWSMRNKTLGQWVSGGPFPTSSVAQAAGNAYLAQNPNASNYGIGSAPQGTVVETSAPAPTSSVPAPDFTAVNAMIDGLEGLDDDQKAILKKYAEANFTKNPELAQNIMAALETSTKFSTPMFKQQAVMLQDALKLNFQAREGDLGFKEQQQRDALVKNEQDYQAALQYGTVEEAQQIKQYNDKLKEDLLTTQDNMAATGFTVSSRRAKAEQILTEQNTGLVESTQRKYGYERGVDERAIAAARTDTAAQIENLQRLAAEGKLADLRGTESKLGTAALSGEYGNLPALLGNAPLLGGQVGSQNYDLTKAITGMASNFVF